MAVSTEFDFHPVANGVDFLDSAIHYLRKAEDSRSLKYAVLHLHAAAEILIKVRLQWVGMAYLCRPLHRRRSQVPNGRLFKRIDDAGTPSALEGRWDLPDQRRANSLRRLNKERNRLQHFGSTSNYKVVEAVAGSALDVLLQFITQHMESAAPDDAIEDLAQAEGVIHTALTEIRSVIRARLERLAPDLDQHMIVIACPACTQMALPAEQDAYACRYCGRDWSQQHTPEQIAGEYAGSVLGHDRYLAGRARDYWPVYRCPECDCEALVGEAILRGVYGTTNLCFSCLLIAADDRLATCLKCGELILDSDIDVCQNCFDYTVSKD